MDLNNIEEKFVAARQDNDLQNALLECELWAAEALALLSQQSTRPFTAAEFLAGVRVNRVPATPAYHPMQLESVMRRPQRSDRRPSI